MEKNATFISCRKIKGCYITGRGLVRKEGSSQVQHSQELFCIIGRNNVEVYLHIMENIILPSVNAVFPQSNFIYQHYNCPIHTPRIISYWMEQQGIRVLSWSSRSPDLNPIEIVWGLMIKKTSMIYGIEFKKSGTN
jgi:hypothetical protein